MKKNMLGNPMSLGEVAYNASVTWFHDRYPRALQPLPWWRLPALAVQEWEAIAQAVAEEIQQRTTVETCDVEQIPSYDPEDLQYPGVW